MALTPRLLHDVSAHIFKGEQSRPWLRREQTAGDFSLYRVAFDEDGAEVSRTLALQVRNAAAESTLDIYAEIGFFGITASDVRAALSKVTGKSIALHNNSPGGDVFEGIAIYNSLVEHPAKVNVTIDSLAASAASFVAQAGDTIRMAKGSMMMIHEAYALVVGPASLMRKQADALDLFSESIAGIYAARAGGSTAEWRTRMTAETWYSDQQAVDAGLADSVAGEAAAKNTFDLSIFRNGPIARREPERESKDESAQPAAPDWRKAARLRVAAAQMEVVHAYAH